MSVGFLLILLSAAADPANWEWLAQQGNQAGRRQAKEALDMRLPPRANNAEPRIEMPAPLPDPAEAQANAAKLFPGIDPQWLAPIHDDTNFRHAENDSFVQLLNVLKAADPEALKKAAAGGVTYVQMFKQPEEYRGQLVTVSGKVRAAFPARTPPNELGIDKCYQIWLEPAYRDDPIVIHCLELPKGFPEGDKLGESVELTGLFFKRYLYQRKDAEMYRAPMLLAKDFKWTPVPPPAPDPTPFGQSNSLYLAVGGALALTVAFVLFAMRRPRRDEVALLHAHRAPRQPLERLKDLEVSPDVQDWLETLPSATNADEPPSDESR